jgi:hypothetical protein
MNSSAVMQETCEELRKHVAYIDLFSKIVSKRSYASGTDILGETHLQILYSRGNPVGHWVWTYYDAKSMNIYASLL